MPHNDTSLAIKQAINLEPIQNLSSQNLSPQNISFQNLSSQNLLNCKTYQTIKLIKTKLINYKTYPTTERIKLQNLSIKFMNLNFLKIREF